MDDPGVFDSGNLEHYRELRRLMLRAAEGQHILALADADAVRSSDFFARAASPMDVEEWSELIERTAFAADAEDRDTEPGRAPSRPFALLAAGAPVAGDRPAHCVFVLRPADAGEWAEQPLRLLLENERDGLLLECMAQAFGASTVEDAYLRGWLRPDGRGGGGEVLVAVRARRRLERLFVFVDSDRTADGGPPGATTAAIVDECATEPRVPCHVTQRREKENYIPSRLLGALAQVARKRRGRTFRQKLEEWLALTEEERHHDDVRSRFGDALTDEALNAMRGCRPEWLRDAGGAEMRDMLARIEEYL